MAETTYKYRGKDLTYEEFMAGPGGKMSTAEAEAALDKASGATRNRRSLGITMGRNGYKKIEKPDDHTLYFTKDGDEISFSTYGEVEKFLLEKGMIKDEKVEAAKAAAEKKEKEKARKEAAAKKEAEKKAAERAKAAAKKEAIKKKEAEKKAADKAKAKAKAEASKKKEAEKKATSKGAAKKPAVTKKAESAKKPGRPAKKNTETAAKKALARRGRPPKNAETKTAAKKTTRTNAQSTAPKGRAAKIDDELVIRVGRKNYTQKRLHDLALDVYEYDMGKDPKAAKKVQTIVDAEKKVCRFVVNGKDKGECDHYRYKYGNMIYKAS